MNPVKVQGRKTTVALQVISVTKESTRAASANSLLLSVIGGGTELVVATVGCAVTTAVWLAEVTSCGWQFQGWSAPCS